MASRAAKGSSSSQMSSAAEDGADQGHPLAHAAGKFFRAPVERIHARPNSAIRAAARLLDKARPSPCNSMPKTALSRAERQGRSRSFLLHVGRPSPQVRNLGLLPRIMSPPSKGVSPARALNRVLLPQPLGPIMATSWPRSTVRLIAAQGPDSRQDRETSRPDQSPGAEDYLGIHWTTSAPLDQLSGQTPADSQDPVHHLARVVPPKCE